MKNTIQIADSELPIMKILWEHDGLTSPEIFAHLDKNVSTLKTLLQRLVNKGVIRIEQIHSRSFRYYTCISKEDYTKLASKNFMQKVFDNSAKQLLLNFVKEEKISKEELLELIDLIEEEKI